MLAPYFGSAVYVVTGSVIGVFLLSLAVGYMLGGWFSVRKDAAVMLGGSLLLTGAWLIVLPFLSETVCEAIFRMGLDEKWGSLAASLVLFGLPTMLLGTVSPTVIHLLGQGSCRTGLHAGVILAASTIASFAGCVVTAFYLVLVSLRQTLVFSGVILLFLSVSILIAAARRGKKQGSCGYAEASKIAITE
jgi:hypothetical protein